jgi:eukaryotic-like serine/threonine-protein kinase
MMKAEGTPADLRIAHFNVLERMGEHALGETFRARDTRFGRTVALKVVRSSAIEPAGVDAFLADARAAAGLSHPNIATLFDVGADDGGWYLAYEYAAGVLLRQEMAGRALSPRRAVEIAVQVADALADAHAQGVLHTDLRPDTIIITQKGSAKVLETGMTRWTRGGATRAAAATAVDALDAHTLNIVAYMSPEQALGPGCDARSDIFSLGVILHEMLTGRGGFKAPTAAETILQIARTPLAAPSSLNHDVPQEIDAVIARATAKGIDGRQQSAASLSAELRSVGAVLDVRSGDVDPRELLPLDDEGGSGKWWAVAIGAGLVALAVWWLR